MGKLHFCSTFEYAKWTVLVIIQYLLVSTRNDENSGSHDTIRMVEPINNIQTMMFR